MSDVVVIVWVEAEAGEPNNVNNGLSHQITFQKMNAPFVVANVNVYLYTLYIEKLQCFVSHNLARSAVYGWVSQGVLVLH